jgi:hypothetical protein
MFPKKAEQVAVEFTVLTVSNIFRVDLSHV